MSVKQNLIDQKEYLKKYLSGDKKKKKKDKKHKKNKEKVIVIDDNLFASVDKTIDEELLLTGEDAPQIVGEIIDLEPKETVETKWRTIGVKNEPDDDNFKVTQIKQEKEDDYVWGGGTPQRKKIKDEFSPKMRKIKKEPRDKEPIAKQVDKKRQSSDSDLSLPNRRRRNRSNSSDLSLPRRRRRNASGSDSDMSLPRRHRSSRRERSSGRYGRKENSRPRKRSVDSDRNPPGRRIMTPTFINSDSDENGDKINNRSIKQERLSPGSRLTPPGRRIMIPAFINSDSDKNGDKVNNRSIKQERLPPGSRLTKEKDSLTPPPPKRPSRFENTESKKSRWSPNKLGSISPPPTHKKADKTLDGKAAGLQKGPALQKENEERRRAEHEMFEKMSRDVSGRDAEIAVRISGRKGRRARKAEAETPEEIMLREKREREKKEIFDRWGKGLKQVEDRRLQMESDAHEASKPLARYSNDEDLDRYLREQEHLEDPMLEYMREKKKKIAKDNNVPIMPKYEGTFPENRFAIRPGYRWDGVDRSNGYERRWFEVRNERRAREEEAYKYSVEDM